MPSHPIRRGHQLILGGPNVSRSLQVPRKGGAGRASKGRAAVRSRMTPGDPEQQRKPTWKSTQTPRASPDALHRLHQRPASNLYVTEQVPTNFDPANFPIIKA